MLKTRSFVGDRDQDSRFKYNYNSCYNYFLYLVFAVLSCFWEKMGEGFFPYFFFLFFNVFRPKAEINILNFYNDSFRQFQFQVVIINALLITT